MQQTKFFAYLNLAAAMVIVGSSVVAGKIVVLAMPVFLASALRFALALAILIPLLAVREGFSRISKRTLGLFALQSLCGSFLFTVCLLYGLEWTTPASAGVITSTTPAVIGLLAWFFLKERPNSRTTIGILLSVAGVAVINLAGKNSTHALSQNPLAGNALVLAAVVFESAFLIIRKGVRENLSPLAASTWVSLFGFAFFAPAGLYEALHFDFTTAEPTAWLAVAYYGVVITVLAYLFWFAGIVHVKAQSAAAMTGIMPVSALTLSWLILHETPGPMLVLACALVVAGILTVSGVTPRLRRAGALPLHPARGQAPPGPGGDG